MTDWIDNFSVRVHNVLKRSGIETEEELYRRLDERGYIGVRNLGRKSLDEMNKYCKRKLIMKRSAKGFDYITYYEELRDEEPIEYKIGKIKRYLNRSWIPCDVCKPVIPCMVCDAHGNDPKVINEMITVEDKEKGTFYIDPWYQNEHIVNGKKADLFIYENRWIAWMPIPKPYIVKQELKGK